MKKTIGPLLSILADKGVWIGIAEDDLVVNAPEGVLDNRFIGDLKTDHQ